MRTKLQYSKKMFMRLARPVFRYSAATVVLLLASGAAPFQCSTSDDLALGIPLQTGNVWTYRGTQTVRTNPTSIPAAFHTAPIKIEMRVVQVVRRAGITGALVRGFPYDLRGGRPATYAIIEVGRKVFLVEGQRAETVFNRLNNRGDSDFGDLVKDSEVLFGTPLAVGQKFCESEQIARDGDMYCWKVTGKRPFAHTGVNGLRAGSSTEYEITNRANDGYSSFGISPGVGITRFSYEAMCASCGDKAEIRLVAYQRGAFTMT